MSYHNVVHVRHQAHDPQRAYQSEYPPPPDFLPPQQPEFPGPPPPPPPQPPHQQGYQDYFYEGYPPLQSAQHYNRHHYQNNPYDYDSGCAGCLNSCSRQLRFCKLCSYRKRIAKFNRYWQSANSLAALCCYCILERCCFW